MPHPAITTGPAAEADLPALAALIASLFDSEPDFAADTAKQLAGLRLLLAEPQRSLVLAAREGGSVVGMLSVQLVASTAQGGWSGLMEDVVVAASHRGRGVGRLLVEAAEAWLRERGGSRMQLLADAENAPALAFYDRLGYAPTRMVCRRKLLPAD